MKKETLNININEAIALCLVFEQFDGFYEKLESRGGMRLVCDLEKLLKEENLFGKGKVKKFYQENKEVIDTINKYYNFKLFMMNDKSDLYNYFLKNKDKLSKILKVLEKMKELGFSYFEFNEEFDFSDEVVKLWKNDGGRASIIYFEHLEVIPSYRKDIIEYKSNDSSYKMVIENPIYWPPLSSRKKIYVNDLTFDAESLPNSITIPELYNAILELERNNGSIYNAIRNSVDLIVGINDVSLLVNKFNETVSKMKELNNKQEMIELLSTIKDILLKMKAVSDEYNNIVIKEQDYITETLLEKEKDEYIKRRTHVW